MNISGQKTLGPGNQLTGFYPITFGNNCLG
jgi:hypothetical protein